jgi:GNAT superfamily N-acetyltransferase
VGSLAVRAERPDEEPGWTLLAEYYEEIASRYPDWSPELGSTASVADMSPPGGRFVVAYLEGQPAGCGTVKRFDEATGEIKRIFVRSAARGHGVARLILRALEEAAAELGYARVVLDTGERLPEARALFRSAGYVEIADYNGNPWAAYWFEKRLSRSADPER